MVTLSVLTVLCSLETIINVSHGSVCLFACIRICVFMKTELGVIFRQQMDVN